jgi:hypothetical protein
MTPRTCAVSVAVVTVLLAPAVAAPQAVEQDPRPDLRTFEAALDRAVSEVSRVSMSPLLPGAQSCHGYHVPGYGAVFVLPPRAFPPNRRLSRSRYGPRSLTQFVTPAQDLEPVAPGVPEKAEATDLRDGGRARGQKPGSDAVETELRRMEEQVEALQQDAEAANRVAEQQLEAIAIALRERAEGAGTAPPGPASHPVSLDPDPPPSAAPPGVPAPPWRFWFGTAGPEDKRSPNRVLNDVRAAVTEALQSEGPRLRTVRPEEFLVVAVDFVVAGGFVDPGAPQQTLVVRVRKKDLDERAAGRMGSDELQKRIEYTTY